MQAMRTWAGRAVVPAMAGAAALVFGVVAPGSAATVNKSLNFTCQAPVIGALALPVTLDITIPDAVKVGDKITPTINVSTKLGGNLGQLFPAAGAKTVDFSAALHTTWSGPASAAQAGTVLDGVMAANGLVPPAQGDWVIQGPATYPVVSPTAAGAANLASGNIDVTVVPRMADGQPTALGTLAIPCTMDAGQDAQILAVTVA